MVYNRLQAMMVKTFSRNEFFKNLYILLKKNLFSILSFEHDFSSKI